LAKVGIDPQGYLCLNYIALQVNIAHNRNIAVMHNPYPAVKHYGASSYVLQRSCTQGHGIPTIVGNCRWSGLRYSMACRQGDRRSPPLFNRKQLATSVALLMAAAVAGMEEASSPGGPASATAGKTAPDGAQDGRHDEPPNVHMTSKCAMKSVRPLRGADASREELRVAKHH
jgi:hypothetical protein